MRFLWGNIVESRIRVRWGAQTSQYTLGFSNCICGQDVSVEKRGYTLEIVNLYKLLRSTMQEKKKGMGRWSR